MNQDAFEHLYVTGDYLILLEEITKLDYNNPSKKFNDIEKAICISYHTRALIRLGNVNEALDIIKRILNTKHDESFSISFLINQTSIINLLNAKGNVTESLKKGLETKTLIEQNETDQSNHIEILTFWSSFLYYLIGIAYYYQYNLDLSSLYFHKSIEVNKTNLFIKGKSLYYIGALELEEGNTKKSNDLFNESLKIFQSIGDRQGTAWIMAWQGRNFLREGDIVTSKIKLNKAFELFTSIRAPQGLNFVNSIRGLIFYQQGEKKKAKEIFEQSFNSSIEIGNPVVLSYCFLPLVLIYIDSGNRAKAKKCIHDFKEFNKNSNTKIGRLHESVAEAIFLKTSSRFIDKGQAQKKFLEIREEMKFAYADSGIIFLPTADKRLSPFIVFNIIELYLEEFKLTEDRTLLSESQKLIDNEIQMIQERKLSIELIELSLLKAKMLIVEGEIDKAVLTLEQIKQDSITNKFHHLEERVDFEIKQINKEFKKWDKALSVKDRIQKIELDEYIKEAQKIQKFRLH